MRRTTRMLIGFAVTLVVLIAVLGGMIAFGTGKAPVPMASIGNPFTKVDYRDLPRVTWIKARDGTSLAARVWSAEAAADVTRVVIAIHGSSAMGASMHTLAKALYDAKTTVYAPDIRGHGDSGRRGDIDYSTQLDDDLADLVAEIRTTYPKATLTLLGFSSGGGYALHAATLPLAKQFERAILISPMLGPFAPTSRSGRNEWVTPFIPRIIGLTILSRLDIHAFDSLPTLAFAIAPENADRLTGSYSFRLMKDFGTLDYAGDLRNAQCPVSVFVGGADELFLADRFEPAIHAVRPDVPVTIVPHLGHIPMILDARSLSTIAAAVSGRES
jgi:alpha-beta hydrolase superfamily lysophospholipase